MTPTPKKKILAKVNVTSDCYNWWESDLSDIFVNADEVTIISAVVDKGALYLIYTYEVDDDGEQETEEL